MYSAGVIVFLDVVRCISNYLFELMMFLVHSYPEYFC